jgi:hypothetical protein
MSIFVVSRRFTVRFERLKWKQMEFFVPHRRESSLTYDKGRLGVY